MITTEVELDLQGYSVSEVNWILKAQRARDKRASDEHRAKRNREQLSAERRRIVGALKRAGIQVATQNDPSWYKRVKVQDTPYTDYKAVPLNREWSLSGVSPSEWELIKASPDLIAYRRTKIRHWGSDDSKLVILYTVKLINRD